jgi:hypothetical protein
MAATVYGAADRLRKGLGIKARIKATVDISFALVMTLWAAVLFTFTSNLELIMGKSNALVACVLVGAASLRSPGWEIFSANER